MYVGAAGWITAGALLLAALVVTQLPVDGVARGWALIVVAALVATVAGRVVARRLREVARS